jgi:nucleoside-diphosphate-sugar epimerase
MRKLVIGCGDLGERIAASWMEQGHEVAALTRSADRAETFRSRGIEPFVGDVTDRDSLCSFPHFDTVLYAVGYDRSTGRSQREIYVDGLRNVLEKIAMRVDRFLYISSTSVYGQTGGEWVDETTECAPTSSNGQVCFDAERLVWSHFPEAPSPGCAHVLRLAGIYGPGRLLRRVESLKSGKKQAGNPDAYLNLIHVDDAVQAILACEARGRAGATYLVCDGKPIRCSEFYETLASLIGTPHPTFAANTDETQLQGLNKRCCNKKLREELQVELAYPTIKTGLPHALGDER